MKNNIKECRRMKKKNKFKNKKKLFKKKRLKFNRNNHNKSNLILNMKVNLKEEESIQRIVKRCKTEFHFKL